MAVCALWWWAWLYRAWQALVYMVVLQVACMAAPLKQQQLADLFFYDMPSQPTNMASSMAGDGRCMSFSLLSS